MNPSMRLPSRTKLLLDSMSIVRPRSPGSDLLSIIPHDWAKTLAKPTQYHLSRVLDPAGPTYIDLNGDGINETTDNDLLKTASCESKGKSEVFAWVICPPLGENSRIQESNERNIGRNIAFFTAVFHVQWSDRFLGGL